MTHEAHRLIIIDESDKVIGIICLSDVLKYLIRERSDESSNEELDENNDKAIDLDKECKEMNRTGSTSNECLDS